MGIVQFATAETPFVAGLKKLLARSGDWEVQSVETPDPDGSGVIVLDIDHLKCLPHPIANARRCLLLSRNRESDLAHAWASGVRAVLCEREPLHTAVLAVLAAGLQLSKSPGRRSE